MFYILQSACGRNCSSEGGTSDSVFDVEKSAGTIIIAKPLDAEQRSFYNLSVQATDGTNTAYTQVHITIMDNNDNTPIFSQPTYDVTISEDTPPDTEVVQVLASDRDEHHQLTYSLQSSIDPSSMRLFRIHSSLGTIYTTQRLDHEACAQHILTVLVKDQEFPYRKNLARVLVEVEDINDHVPIFTSALYEGSVYESAAVGSAVVQITALDKDKGENAELHYSIEAGNTGNAFHIESVLGIITVAQDLDLSSIGHYVLTIRVTDNGSPPLSTTTIVRIAVTLSDNAGPKFPQPEYHAEITENAVVGTSVNTVSAVSQSTLTYDIKKGNADRVFQINQYSGVITTQKTLDYETTASYTLIVQATNMAGMASNATLLIQVVDENDNPPVFQQLHYHGSISEAAPVNSVVLNSDDSPLVIKATDTDHNQNALLVYQIVEDTAKMFFTVDSGTGSIRTIANLDHETFATFHFHVHVRDNGRPQLTADSPTEVTIQVIDTNDSPPRFTQNAYETVLLLPTYVGVEALQVSAIDPDKDVPSELTYSLTDGVLEHFAIKPSSGVITVKNNNFSKERFRFSVKVSDGTFSSTSLVTILVREALDSGLSFSQSLYSSSIQENVSNITKVAVVNAVGNRLNEPLKYTLLNAGTSFIIRPTSGVIQTTGIPFDREEQEFYELVVEARREHDHLHVARVMVRVQVEDINDNSPVFVGLPYYAAVQVEAEPGSPIFRVMAVDGDKGINGEVSYYLKDNHDHFDINQLTGGLSLKRAFESDLSNMEYQMVIYARDGGYPPLSSTIEFPITVVNKAMPVFDKPFYSVSVNEDVAVQTPILGINATSPEGQSIIYTIVDGDPSLQFDIGFDTGVVSVIHSLDYEAASSYHLTIRATDYLTDAFIPSFSQHQYLFSLPEDTPIGSAIGTVHLNTSPGHALLSATFALVNGETGENNQDGMFVVEKDTGGNYRGVFALGLVQGEWKMYVKWPLDREERNLYIINVTASDGLFVSQATVEVTVIDTNDNSPICNQAVYTASVPEDLPVNRMLLMVGATDADVGISSWIQYSLHGPGSQDFIMDPDTGEVKSSTTLDHEMTPYYRLVAQATDGGGRWCRAEVHLDVTDVNDNPPIFTSTHYTASVYEDTAPKALLTRIQAIDPDEAGPGRMVAYSLSESAGGSFSIDKSSGIVVLERILDREVQPAYQIVVHASDQGSPLPLSSLVNVTITVLDINDNPPVFERRDQLATVPEDVGVGTEVLRVYAASKDIGTNAEITYSIRSGNEHGKFHIHPLTGAILVAQPLNYETCRDYFLTVEARDGGTPPLSAITTVNINLTDVNDNAPMFSRELYTAVVSEDATTGESVVQLVAEDVDSQLNGAILYSIISGDRDNQFFMDPLRGVIKVNKPLDRETVPSYSLAIRALDSGIPPMSSTVIVNIDISDINDNPPTFSPANLTTVIQENKPISTSILQLSVIDQDSSHNGPPFDFRILSGNEGGEFVLEKDGTLLANQVFRRDLATEYAILIQVTDSGKPRLSSSSMLTVRVIEESLHRPVALPLEVHIVTMEDEFPGGVIGQLHATDADPYDVLTFGHAPPAQRSLFKISPRDGKIIALGGLDAGRYSLNASVSDGRFAVPVPVSVHVEQATPEMLREAVTVRFESVSPQDFVALHLKSVLKVLQQAAASQQQDKLHLLSLQPVGGTQQLDMLVAVETAAGEYYKAAYLTQKLSASRRQLEEVLRVSAILDKNCSGLECRGAQCEQTIVLDSHNLATYSTPRVSFVSPRFHRTSRCTCNDASCAVLSEQCEEQPCPADMQCVSLEATRGRFACQCPPGKLGECAGHSSLSFSGNSYIKYRLAERLQTELKLSLRIRTLQSKGIIMYTHTEPCTVLKLEEGKLWFQLACGEGEGGDSADMLGISGRRINDGSWHTVALELNRNFSSLTLDDSYVERRRGPPFIQPLAPDRTIYFGAMVQHPNSRSLVDSQKDPRVLNGFQGCLDSVTLNNNELPLQNKRSRYAEVVGLTELKLGCILYPDACLQQPCRNGATCTSLPSGGFSCSCNPQYTGGRCEMEITACVPNPCQNGGVCKPIGNAFFCSCRRGFKGLMCEEDVNECDRSNLEGECENGGVCVNTYGSFYCNCTVGFVGQRCGLRPVVVPDMQAGHTVKVFQKNYSRNNLSLVQDPATAALLNKANGVQFKTLHCTPGDPLNLYSEPTVLGVGGMMCPPQVPVRPMAYTPCFQGDPRSTLEKMVDGRGAEHTEMSTFHPESPRILSGTTRRGVVVCSVAPNLPPVSPCRSDCDSLCKSPWDSDEGKMVDMAEEVTCFSGSNKGSNSEVQSLSSFQSDSCDDNASIVTVIRLVNDAVDTIESEAYHWDTSDWMPNTRLSDIEEVPGYEAPPSSDVACSAPRLGGSTRELESDYYLGGYDIDSDYPPPHEEEFLSLDQLPPPLPTGSAGHQQARPNFHPSQYLPPHQLPLGEASHGDISTPMSGVTPGNGDTDDSVSLNMRLSVGASSTSDMSAPGGLDDSEHGSDFDSMDELRRGVTIITDSQQQTEV
ncbi:hypothetical protein CesoFtcFv8_006701 [Champsocephalus esox]|uniref:Protocadherin Fat 3 n=1 Tax=Champsocephalus esox TaxID=159716 RepID=A0AAN8CJZ5_9TELE|nr:hypothetical protein CesoFtcFv8_006701 [Champsocephalus esox]